ncbi:TPA: hypothetical protein G9C53_004879 [Salmonella enterica subsp. enterica serovar Typhimurium var. 5-]|uniref:Uncharacterized protein n=1 Tax=Salmonella enterica subsp. enterica serovar Typhimurium var. 5- TaxID=1620419 RepID=A0A740TKK7_SALTM|nr:hypothetical protein [Salmonella enterica subsp. enterica serovar Typhimurium var. 5-]
MVTCEFFKELQEQITNRRKWEKDRFVVFDYEAGLGKSQNTFRFIGEMVKEMSYKVLFVQKFVRDDELKNTVSLINEHAGREVAFGFTGEESKKERHRQHATDTQVLCVSHSMYIQFCKGAHQELWKKRDILIIDEYPDLLERVTLSEADIGSLWMINYKYRSDVLENLASGLRKKFSQCTIQRENKKGNQMAFVDFNDPEFQSFENAILELLKMVTDKRDEALLLKVLQILQTGCLFYEKTFHTFDNQIKLLKNNILLDANGFDYRYTLSKKFIVKSQPKFFKYNHSTFLHYEVNTSKKGLSRQINLPEKALDVIASLGKAKTLFVTDKESRPNLEATIAEYLGSIGWEEAEIKEMLNETIRIDYFGNIIGVNTYKDFDNVVVLKTPNYDYLTYALMYFYFQSMNGNPIEDIDVFRNDIVEKIRNTAIAGEIYQAVKRVNRDNTRSSNIYVFTSNQDAVDIVLTQLPGIQYKKEKLTVNNKKEQSTKNTTVFQKQVKEAKQIILDAKSRGITALRKQEIRELIGISYESRGNFTRILDAIQPFLEAYDLKSTKREIILVGS